MDLLQTIVLGLTQGITEFIPVSSSGHLTIVHALFGGDDANFHAFLELINFGTLIALIIYFRHRLAQIWHDFCQHRYKLLVNIIVTCIPAGLAGLLLSHVIKTNSFLSSFTTLAIMMALIGLLMINIDKMPHLSKLKNEQQLTPGRAFAIGLAQILALIPGASRSGTTMVAGRLVGLNNKSAAEYSFLVAIPLMLAVCGKTLLDSGTRDYLFANFGTVILGNLVAFAIGLAVIKPLLNYLKKPHSLRPFGYYRLFVAAIILIFVLIA